MIDIEVYKQVPLLLGRPFLATGADFIDVKKGELTPRVGDEAVQFNLNQSLIILNIRLSKQKFPSVLN